MSFCMRGGVRYKRHRYKTKYGETKCEACGGTKVTPQLIEKVSDELVERMVQSVKDSWKEIDPDCAPLSTSEQPAIQTEEPRNGQPIPDSMAE